MQKESRKKGKKQCGLTLHQLIGVAINLRMRTAISPGQVSGNHEQLFRPF